MIATRRTIARRRSHDISYALLALSLVVLSALYGAVLVDFFGWERLRDVDAGALPFLALVFSPCAALLAMLLPVWEHWYMARPYVSRY